MMFFPCLLKPNHWAKIVILILCCHTSIINAQCDRKAIIDDFIQNHKGTDIFSTEDLGWSGDADECVAGTISASALAKTLQRINYYRRLAKLTTEVTFDTSLTAMCQEAALMMHSNNALMHDPPNSWKCYSDDGKKAAGRSNLALGAHTSNAIALYMIDPGTSNYAVGHRRWILYSRAKEFGMGSTSRAHSLYVVNNKIPAPENHEYTAYPSQGFFPAPLVPDRWSLSIPGADFQEVKITMQNQEGESIPVAIQEVKNGFGDNTIVWEPESDMIEKYSEYDRTYHIQVQNITVSGETRDVEYEVTIADAVHPPACSNGEAWSESLCGCPKSQTTPVTNFLEEPEVLLFPNPASETIQLTLPSEWTSVEIQISNSMGCVITEKKATSSTFSTSVRGLPTGVYFVRIQHQNQVHTRKLSIQH